MKKKFPIPQILKLPCVMLFILLVLIATLFLVHDYRCFGWTWFHISHRDYLQWKKQGGPFLTGYNLPLQVDRDRAELVKGLSYDQIRKKIPNLYDGEQYSKHPYKSNILHGLQAAHPETRMLWFNEPDSFDFAIIIDHEGTHLELFKG